MNPPRFAPYFGDYFLIGKIADEPSFEVWLARQESLNRRVALRVLRSEHLGSIDAIRQFEVTANAASRLRHEDIVQVYEVGNYGGRPFISMEYLEGGSLAGQLAAGQWNITPVNHDERQAAIARLIVRVARAIHHAHQHGVLHGHLTPADVLFNNLGHPRVANFGTGNPVDTGAVPFRPPEVPVWERPLEEGPGSPVETTTATDITGLGAMLYHLLAGRAHGIEQAARTPAARAGPPAPEPKPTDLNPNVDNALERICLKSLGRELEVSYSCANELANDLEQWLSNETRPSRSLGQMLRRMTNRLRQSF